MVTSTEVHEYIAQAGPVLPKHVAEAFGISTLFASAFLNELSAKSLVNSSHLKIGGSPLYYTHEHRDRLVDYRGNLHEKEQKTFELLRSEKILDDSKLELLDRVALRKMEDFAVPLAVDAGGERRIFWKYYLLDDREATRIVGDLLEAERADRERADREAPETETQTTPEPVADREHESHGSRSEPNERSETDTSDTRSEQRSEASADRTDTAPDGTDTPATDTDRDEPDEAEHDTRETIASRQNEEDPSVRSRAPERSAPASQSRASREERQSKIAAQDVSVTHAPDASEVLVEDPLGKRIVEYFTEKGIGVTFAQVPRKNTCLGVCSVPSPIGELDYFFYSKEKKSITEKDIKEAFAEAAILGYPLLYLARGDVKKNATELIGSKIKGSIIIELS